MKKHYVTKWEFEHKLFIPAACGNYVYCIDSYKEATYRKNYVTCGNCRRTKMFRGVR